MLELAVTKAKTSRLESWSSGPATAMWLSNRVVTRRVGPDRWADADPAAGGDIGLRVAAVVVGVVGAIAFSPDKMPGRMAVRMREGGEQHS